MAEAIDIVVDASGDGLRLDRFVRDRFPAASLALVRRALDTGDVAVNGRPARKGDKLRAGDRVSVAHEPPPAEWTPEPDGSVHLLWVFQDDDVAAVAKPAGVPTVPLRPGEGGTVAGALLHRHPALAGLGRTPRDCGLISRLDRGTSGLLLAAMNRPAFDALLDAVRGGRVAKGYMALVEGVRAGPWPSTIRRPLRAFGPRGAAVVAGASGVGEGTPETRILRARAGHGVTLVVAEIRRGRRHQIRAHLASLGHPVVGDVERGGRTLPDGGLGLHAAWIVFPHPRTGLPLRVEAPPMEPLASALREARILVRRRDAP